MPVPPVPVPKAVIVEFAVMFVPVTIEPMVNAPDDTAVIVNVLPDTEPVPVKRWNTWPLLPANALVTAPQVLSPRRYVDELGVPVADS